MEKAQDTILIVVFFLLPLFFLPVTPEYFVTAKFFLLIFTALLLLSLSFIKFVHTRRLAWSPQNFSITTALLLTAAVASTAISAPNKVASLLNPYFGLALLLTLAVIFYYAGSKKQDILLNSLVFSGVALSAITVVLSFDPFRRITVIDPLLFLKNPVFTPAGSPIELAVFLGFVALYVLGRLIVVKKTRTRTSAVILCSVLVGLSIILYQIVKPLMEGGRIALTPFSLSWQAALQIFKEQWSITAFGFGPDNFSVPLRRNLPQGGDQLGSFFIQNATLARSTFLQLLTEVGLVGILAFLAFLIGPLIRPLKSIKQSVAELLLFLYIVIILIFFPPSPLIFFLLFTATLTLKKDVKKKPYMANLRKLLPIYVLLLMIFGFSLLTLTFLAGRAYAAKIYSEIAYKELQMNKLSQSYKTQRTAVVLNPYSEEERRNLSQTAILVAEYVATTPEAQKGDKKLLAQGVMQAIQAAIEEAKAAVGLNPQKVENWANLGEIYTASIGAIPDAQGWVTTSYLRAVNLEPTNVNYNLILARQYFANKAFPQAIPYFEQALRLNPLLIDVYYPYIIANIQVGNLQGALVTLNALIGLLENSNTNNSFEQDLVNLKKDKAEIEQQLKKLQESPQPKTGAQ